MKNEMIDERIIFSKRKIQSDGFMIVWLILLVSTLVQQYLGAPITQYIVEIVVFLFMSVYLLFFNLVKGNEFYPTGNKKSNALIITQSIFTGLVIAVINTVQNYFNYSDKVQDSVVIHVSAVAVVSFISGTVVTFVVLKILAYLNEKRQQKINTCLDNDE